MFMRLLIRHLSGSFEAAMLLNATENTIRAALPGCEDAAEFKWIGRSWVSESGEPVEIDFDPGVEVFFRSINSQANAESSGLESPFATGWAAGPSRVVVN